MFTNFRKWVTGKDEIHKYMQYEASMTVYIGRSANERKVTKSLSFQKM